MYQHASMRFINAPHRMFDGDTEQVARDTVVLGRVLQCTVRSYADSPEFNKKLFDDFNALYSTQVRVNFLDVAHLIL